MESIDSQTNLSSKAVLNLLTYSPSGEVAGVGVSIKTAVTLGRPRGEDGVVLGPPLVEAMKRSAQYTNTEWNAMRPEWLQVDYLISWLALAAHFYWFCTDIMKYTVTHTYRICNSPHKPEVLRGTYGSKIFLLAKTSETSFATEVISEKAILLTCCIVISWVIEVL